MSNKELYKQAFSALQMTGEISLENTHLAIIRKKAAFRTALATAAAALMIILVGGGTAYATNLGDIQSTFEMWLKRNMGNVVFKYDKEDTVEIEYIDKDGNRQLICQWDDPDCPGPLTFEEEKELIDGLYNDLNVEFMGGVVTLYLRDQVVDITDKFENGICEIVLHGSNNYEVSATIDYEEKAMSTSGMYDDLPEKGVTEEYTYHQDFSFWTKGKRVLARLYYDPDGYYEIGYVDTDGELACPGGCSPELEELLKEKGEDHQLTEDEIEELFNNQCDVVFNADRTVILYYKDQVIDITDKFTAGICEIHVIGKPRGMYVTVDYADKSFYASEDMSAPERTSQEDIARIEHRPFPSYPNEELKTGAMRIDEKGRLMVRPAIYQGNRLVEYLGDEMKMNLSQDAFIYYCPIDGYWGETTTVNYFLDYLNYHRMGVHYHLDDSGQIDYIRGIPN